VVLLLPVVNVPIFLILGGLALWARLSDEHGVLLTTTGWVTVLGSIVTPKSVAEHYMDSTTSHRCHGNFGEGCTGGGLQGDGLCTVA
jgi:hypothetical protein